MSDDLSTVPYAFVVDDDAMILMHALDILEDAGFRTLSAHNGDDALEKLAAHDDEVVLLFTDVEMPGSMDGFELARTVSKRWPDIGILVASGRLKADEGAMPEGALFVSKPFSANVIFDRLHDLLTDGKKPEPLKRKVK